MPQQKARKSGKKGSAAYGRQLRSGSFIRYWQEKRHLRALKGHILRLEGIANPSPGQESELQSARAQLENKRHLPVTVKKLEPRRP